MAPEFDKIDTSLYEPAFDAGIEEQRVEIEAIANNSEAPTFENTFGCNGTIRRHFGPCTRRFQQSLWSYLKMMNISVSMPKWRRIAEHRDNIYLNKALFDRVAAVYDNKDTLNKEDQRLVEY